MSALQTITYRHPKSGRIVTFQRHGSGNAVNHPPGPFDTAELLRLGERSCRDSDQHPSARNIARHLGVTPRTVIRWRTGATVGAKLATADEASARLGVYIEDLAR